MLSRRIVPCLDVRDGRVVKGVRFSSLRDAGDPAELGAVYAAEGADELVFLDISATPEARRTAIRLAERVARRAFIPFTVGGGLRSVEGMREVLHAGADRVAVNTAAVRDPDLLRRAAERFGSQAVVVAIDAKRTGGSWEVFVRSGSEPTGLDAVAWAVRAAELGAGEILLTSIDRDGTQEGYDLELLEAVCGGVRVPVIASGGAGEPGHFAHAFESGASAALAASLFHFGRLRIPELKRWLADRGFPVRPAEEAAEGGPGGEPEAGRGRLSEGDGDASPERTPRGELRPAIVQTPDGEVRMLGYMDEAALERTLEAGRVTFYSRSRRRLWTKGETSGNWLEAISVRTDCDGDALLVLARAHGPTCHTGARGCFDAGGRPEPAGVGGVAEGPDPETDLGEVLRSLWEVILRRDHERPSGSHTARLLGGGAARAAQKLGEEAVETALAALEDRGRLVEESADLMYHLLVLWRAAGVAPEEVAGVLAARRGEAGDERAYDEEDA